MVSDLVLPRLLERARAGEREAWASLVERWRHRVVVALMAEGFGIEGARDLAQEAWAAIWDKHQRGELERLELPGLVIAHARLLAMDERRRARRSLSDGTERPPVPTAEPRLMAAQTLRRVEAVLGQRSAQQQRIDGPWKSTCPTPTWRAKKGSRCNACGRFSGKCASPCGPPSRKRHDAPDGGARRSVGRRRVG